MNALERLFFVNGRPRRWLMVLAGLLIIYLAGGAWVLPGVLRGVMEKQLSALTGSSCTLEKIRFNPLNLRLELFGLRVPHPDGSPFLYLEALDSRPGLPLISRLAPSLGELKLINPEIHLVLRKDGRLSMHDFIPARAAEENPEPAPVFPFILTNLAVFGGKIHFTDELYDQKHEITDLFLQVPFTSSLPSDHTVAVEPRLEAVVDGRPFVLRGESTPFADNPRTSFEFNIDNLDLIPFQNYLAGFSSLVVSQGRFSTRIGLEFQRPAGEPLSLTLRGQLKLDELALDSPADGRVLALESAVLELESRFLDRPEFTVESLTFTKVEVLSLRRKNGVLNWSEYFTPKQAPGLPAQQETTTSSGAVEEPGAGANAVLNATAPAPPTPEQVSAPDETKTAHAEEPGAFQGIFPGLPPFLIREVRLERSSLRFKDETLAAPAEYALAGINVTLHNFSAFKPEQRPGNEALPAAAGVNATRGAGPAATNAAALPEYTLAVADLLGGSLALSGRVNLTPTPEGPPLPGTELDFTLDGLDLRRLNAHLESLAGWQADSGLLGTRGQVNLEIKKDKSLEARLSKGGLSLDKLALRPRGAKEAPLSLQRAALEQVSLDLAKQTLSAAALRLDAPQVRLVRLADGRVILDGQAAGQAGPGAKASSTTPKTASPAWKLNLAGVNMSAGRVSFADAGVAAPGAAPLVLDKLSLKTGAVSSDMGRSIDFALTGALDSGILDLKGKVQPEPLKLDLKAGVERLSLTPLAPYIARQAKLELQRGGLSANCDLSLAGDDVKVDGAFRLTGLSLTQNKKSLLALGLLDVDKFSFDSRRKRLEIGALKMNSPTVDFVLLKQGGSNFSRIAGEEKSEADTKPVSKADAAPAKREAGVVGGFSFVSVKFIQVEGGTLRFTDERLSPPVTLKINDYKASLSSFTSEAGSVSSIRTGGKLDGVPLALDGEMNPVRLPLSGEAKFAMNYLDLVPLSPYAARYLGYPVEGGKLSLKLEAKFDQDTLDSRNKAVLTRLRLGERSKEPGAPDLPVKAGLSLLQDSNGNVELLLPISGNLDDPQFKIGNVVGQAIGNLMLKIMTSPFSLLVNIITLGGALGGGPDLQFIEFAPGDAVLDAKALDVMKTVVEVLQKRPELLMDLTGMSDTDERAALLETRLKRFMQEEKYKSLSRQERAKSKIEDMRVGPEVDAEEYADLLFEFYADQPFDKERNAIGLVKKLPPEEMLRIIREKAEITDQDLNNLALQRSRNVREYLIRADESLIPRTDLGTPKGPLPHKEGERPNRAVRIGIGK